MAFVFQNATLMPWARVRQNVRLLPELENIDRAEKINRTKAEQRIDQTLQMVGLEKFHDSFPRELSGGMQMRASIARALGQLHNPIYYWMDEPLGHWMR
ncbi:ATP-binding cassette domain-containing protein [Vibrio sp. PP-XX7]